MQLMLLTIIYCVAVTVMSLKIFRFLVNVDFTVLYWYILYVYASARLRVKKYKSLKYPETTIV